MMDRNHADELPKMQCGFIDFVCSFVYKVPRYKLFTNANMICIFSKQLPPLFQFFLILCVVIHALTHVYVCAGVCSFPLRGQAHVRWVEYQQEWMESSRWCPRGQDEGNRGREEKAGRWRHTRWALTLKITTPLLILHHHPSLIVCLIHSFYSPGRWEVKDLCYRLDISDCHSMHECLSGCVFVQGVYVYEQVVTDEGILMSKNHYFY